jgi:4-oxalocrotonate tautomerase
MRSLSDAVTADRIRRWHLARDGSRVEGGQDVPFIDVKVMEGVLTTEQKQKVAQGFTDVFADIVGSPARPLTWVVIQDVASGEWTMGGDPITTDGVKQLLGGEPASV